jgi:hypothetical protein
MSSRSFPLQQRWCVYELSRGHNRLDLDVKGTVYFTAHERHGYYDQTVTLSGEKYSYCVIHVLYSMKLGPESNGVSHDHATVTDINSQNFT